MKSSIVFLFLAAMAPEVFHMAQAKYTVDCGPFGFFYTYAVTIKGNDLKFDGYSRDRHSITTIHATTEACKVTPIKK